MKKLYIFIFIACFFTSEAQRKMDLEDKWAWSVNSSVFSFSNIKQKKSIGFDAEWFMSDNWSLRGGVSINSDYLKITTEPFVLYLLTGLGSSDTRRHSHSHYRSHNYSGGRNAGKGMLVLLLLILDSDALCYNIPVSDKLYVSLFASPLQTIYTFSDDRTHMYSLVGGGLKYVSPHGLTLNANVEYDKSFLFRDGSYGMKANFSLGYIFH